METALYFPYISVPQTPWFTQVLLYWDDAASIVPYDVRDDPNVLSPYMLELQHTNLLQLMAPEETLGVVDYQDFAAGFLALVDAQEPMQSPPELTRVHLDKMSWGVFSALKDRGLAERGQGMWWQVETSSAGLYMGYLASVMSAAAPGMLPVTDRSQAVATLAGTSGDVLQRLSALRYRVITEALPAPTGPVSADELRRFKDHHADKLHRCRRHLDGKLADLAAQTEPALQEVQALAVLQEIEDDVARLTEQMRQRRWPGVTLRGFGGVMGAALATAATIASGGTALAVGLGVGAAAMGTLTAGYETADLLREPRFDARAPLAYAALTGRM